MPTQLSLPVMITGIASPSFKTGYKQVIGAGPNSSAGAKVNTSGGIDIGIPTATTVTGTQITYTLNAGLQFSFTGTPICANKVGDPSCIPTPSNPNVPPLPTGISLVGTPTAKTVIILVDKPNGSQSYDYALNVSETGVGSSWLHPRIKNDNVAFKLGHLGPFSHSDITYADIGLLLLGVVVLVGGLRLMGK